MGVDSTNQAPNGRSSVRVTSKKQYNSGTLIILDLQHMPVGCATWPAFWTYGPNWPSSGEIDILEGVNNQGTNQMTLHTTSGCTIKNNGLFSGSISTSNCDVNAQGQYTNAGCSIAATNENTYGSGLNAIGGGVYAMSWTDEAITMWFFPRNDIPADIVNGAPTLVDWGRPLSEFSSASCDIPQFFQNNNIVFDTTFCGDWAGQVWSTSGCASTQYPTCESFVENNPSAFQNAYWQINSLRVYSSSSSASDETPSSPIMASSIVSHVPVTTETSSNNNDQKESDDDKSSIQQESSVSVNSSPTSHSNHSPTILTGIINDSDVSPNTSDNVNTVSVNPVTSDINSSTATTQSAPPVITGIIGNSVVSGNNNNNNDDNGYQVNNSKHAASSSGDSSQSNADSSKSSSPSSNVNNSSGSNDEDTWDVIVSEGGKLVLTPDLDRRDETVSEKLGLAVKEVKTVFGSWFTKRERAQSMRFRHYRKYVKS